MFTILLQLMMPCIVFCVSHVGFILSKYGGVVSKKSSKVEGDRFWDPPKVKKGIFNFKNIKY